jgi:hypothetical protein
MKCFQWTCCSIQGAFLTGGLSAMAAIVYTVAKMDIFVSLPAQHPRGLSGRELEQDDDGDGDIYSTEL